MSDTNASSSEPAPSQSPAPAPTCTPAKPTAPCTLSLTLSDRMQVGAAIASLIDIYFSTELEEAVYLLRATRPGETVKQYADRWAQNVRGLDNGSLVERMSSTEMTEVNRAVNLWYSFYQKLSVYWECGGPFFKSLLYSHDFPSVDMVENFLDVCQVYEKAMFMRGAKATEKTWLEQRPSVYAKTEAILTQLRQ